MGLYKGVLIKFRDVDYNYIPFWIMWNDDFHFDELIHGVYYPDRDVIEIWLHASPIWRGLREPRLYYFKKYSKVDRSLLNRTLVVDGIVVSFWDGFHSDDVAYSISDISCESALRKLSIYSHAYNSNGIHVEVVPFRKVIELLKEELYGRVSRFNILYLLMRKAPSPLGFYRVNIIDINGDERVSTTLPFNHKYIDPPEYMALIPNDMESCFVDEDEILCTGYGGKYSVSIKKSLVEKYIVNMYGDVQVIVTRYIGEMFNGETLRLKSSLPDVLYHITYGKIL